MTMRELPVAPSAGGPPRLPPEPSRLTGVPLVIEPSILIELALEVGGVVVG